MDKSVARQQSNKHFSFYSRERAKKIHLDETQIYI